MAARIVEIEKIDKLKADSLQRSWPNKKKREMTQANQHQECKKGHHYRSHRCQ